MSSDSARDQQSPASQEVEWTFQRAVRDGFGWGVLFGVCMPLLLLLGGDGAVDGPAAKFRPRRLTVVQYVVTGVLTAAVFGGELWVASQFGWIG